MQYTDPNKACYIYLNSTGCSRADGEVVGFETEATAIYDTMKYIGNEVSFFLFRLNLLIFLLSDLHSWNWSGNWASLCSFICWR
jgi:hypothetical protein